MEVDIGAFDALSIDEQVDQFLTPNDGWATELRQDPYPFFDRLRATAPVYHAGAGPFLITGYDETVEYLRFEAGKRERWLGVPKEERSPAQRIFFENVAFSDPPAHTRLRKMIAPLFSPARTERRREQIRETVHRLIDEVRDSNSFDFLHDFANRVPITVIAELIGMPSDSYGDLIEWADQMVAIQEPGIDPTALKSADAAALDALDFFGNLVAERRDRDGDDLISYLLQRSDEHLDVTREEIVSTCLVLHIGGYETTANLIANGMSLLGRYPDAHRELRRDPSLVPGAVEEMLRFEGSARRVGRFIPEDVQIGDTTIPAGSSAFAILGAADRDVRQFPDPHRFDIRRDPNRHVAFGLGLHFCLGASLARVEAQEVFRTLMAECPELAVDADNAQFKPSFLVRGLESLPASWAETG